MRLIDADVLIDKAKKNWIWEKDEEDKTVPIIRYKDIVDAPTVDTERHGHWISDRLCSTNGGTYGIRRCSNCEYYYNDFGDEWNYCPDCGAKMDEV